MRFIVRPRDEGGFTLFDTHTTKSVRKFRCRLHANSACGYSNRHWSLFGTLVWLWEVA
jgi:hypothetical protein